MGSIMPAQTSALSPGLISTCLLQRQPGQWFVYPDPATSAPQFSHVKSSCRLVNLLLICAEAYELVDYVSMPLIILIQKIKDTNRKSPEFTFISFKYYAILLPRVI